MRRIRHQARTIDIWPGFVDALAALLIVIIFLLLVFSASQFFLSYALSTKEHSLEKLNTQVTYLADLLSLEQSTVSNLTSRLGDFAAKLSQTAERLSDAQKVMAAREVELGEKRAEIERQDGLLIERRQTIDAKDATIQNQSNLLAEQHQKTLVVEQKFADQIRAIDEAEYRLAALHDNVVQLQELRQELEREIAGFVQRLARRDQEMTAAEQLSAASIAQVEVLNRQVKALRDQLSAVAAVLAVAPLAENEDLSRFGERLNLALARRAQELVHYRSDFFGRLRKVLGDNPAIEIVGDRFVLQSELLFATASAELGSRGRAKVAQIATILESIANDIPPDIDWIVRIDGHTDSRPISTSIFPSNWVLSAARAIAIVNHLIANGVSPQRLAAAGFGEFHPLDVAQTEAAFARNRRIEIKLTAR